MCAARRSRCWRFGGGGDRFRRSLIDPPPFTTIAVYVRRTRPNPRGSTIIKAKCSSTPAGRPARLRVSVVAKVQKPRKPDSVRSELEPRSSYSGADGKTTRNTHATGRDVVEFRRTRFSGSTSHWVVSFYSYFRVSTAIDCSDTARPLRTQAYV